MQNNCLLHRYLMYTEVCTVHTNLNCRHRYELYHEVRIIHRGIYCTHWCVLYIHVYTLHTGIYFTHRYILYTQVYTLHSVMYFSYRYILFTKVYTLQIGILNPYHLYGIHMKSMKRESVFRHRSRCPITLLSPVGNRVCSNPDAVSCHHIQTRLYR